MTDRPGLARTLLDLQSSFSWPVTAGSYEQIATWERSRSGSVFYRFAGAPSGPEVLVKMASDWGEEDAEGIFGAMADLVEIIDAAHIKGGRGVRPLAWGDNPPLVAMEYVVGTDVVSILREPTHEAWSEDLRNWMGIAGGMLAAFHASRLTSPLEDISTARQEATALASRYRIKVAAIERILNQVDWRHRCARSFGDFGPGNLLGTPDGDLYLLDPPDRPTTALIHRDLANFVFELRRQLAGRGYTRSRPITGVFDQLRSAFISGYSANWPEEPLGGGDEALIALFELRRAAGMARKRFPRRVRDSAWFARSALARRREVIRV